MMKTALISFRFHINKRILEKHWPAIIPFITNDDRKKHYIMTTFSSEIV